MQPLSFNATVPALVWIVSGLVVLVAKVGFFAKSASIFWEYVGGLMILFGLVRLFAGLFRGSKNTKPGVWSRFL
ncbi:hypothetical protein E6H19_06000 [Candidatus Bathyarchaeota archaeon]|nr:MAG: hypothetical protein E6H30_02095 [Candidatus Bathyarchaeota archaeon]TMI44983.1 MAG: hypothetical protein E6H19_06000 [Candidatus Bathyarchaeota archaeon]